MQNMFISEIWSIVRTRNGNAVLLKPRDMEVAVPVFVGALELQSILIGRDGVNMSRPLTHDLFLNMLTHVNLAVKKVEIHKIKNNTFHSRLVITGGEYTGENPLILDSRPSDSLAIAARKKCPIFISSTIIEQTGVPLNFFINAFEENSNDRHKALREQLEQAVAEEEYEQAAEIRDLLRKLEDETDLPII